MLEQKLLAAERERAVARRNRRRHCQSPRARKLRRAAKAPGIRGPRGWRHGRAAGGSATSRRPGRSPRQARSPCARNWPASRARGAPRTGSIRFPPPPACLAADRRPRLPSPDRAVRARTPPTPARATPERVPPGTIAKRARSSRDNGRAGGTADGRHRRGRGRHAAVKSPATSRGTDGARNRRPQSGQAGSRQR